MSLTSIALICSCFYRVGCADTWGRIHDSTDRTVGRGNTGRNWIHVNAVDYSADDDSIIVSARRQGVWKLTVTSSETNFGFAPSPAAASSTL
ncbi:aryl-sulfate sulfotransferase [Pseudomonas sp. YQ_5]|uniref:aryl-sulfate sulfotransferase n=1 Tax=Pseudomonas sp. YQ_5 TaxID=3367229 RepID=UPI00370CEECD